MFELDDGTEMALRGTITTFSADNKAAWSIAGFKDLGRAFRRCQFCLAVNEDMQTKVCLTFLYSMVNGVYRKASN